jgi:alanine-synthesizing transaminase
MLSARTNWQLTANRLSLAVEAHRQQGRKLLDLTASNPTSCGFEYDAARILNAFIDPMALRYEPDAKGMLRARCAVAGYYRELLLSQPAPERLLTELKDRLLLTTSTSEAYSFVFRLLCDAGDEVLVPTPSYPLFDYLAVLQDVNLARYSLVYHDGWQIDFHSLEQAITPRTRAIMLVHPNNPTGSFVKEHEREQLNALCAGHGLALVVDEVFLDYTLEGCEALASHRSPNTGERLPPQQAQEDSACRGPRVGHPHPSFVTNQEALTFTLSGISKISGLPQMKLAWIAVSGPEDRTLEAMARLEVIADTFLSMNAPVQLAAPVLLDERQNIQPQMKERIAANLAELDAQLATNSHCTRLKVEGGWYAVLRVPVTRSDEELAIELISKHDTLVQPGYFYDFEGDGYLVLSLITPKDEFASGVERVLKSGF